jgi:hypothetical protein
MRNGPAPSCFVAPDWIIGSPGARWHGAGSIDFCRLFCTTHCPLAVPKPVCRFWVKSQTRQLLSPHPTPPPPPLAPGAGRFAGVALPATPSVDSRLGQMAWVLGLERNPQAGRALKSKQRAKKQPQWYLIPSRVVAKGVQRAGGDVSPKGTGGCAPSYTSFTTHYRGGTPRRRGATRKTSFTAQPR